MSILFNVLMLLGLETLWLVSHKTPWLWSGRQQVRAWRCTRSWSGGQFARLEECSQICFLKQVLRREPRWFPEAHAQERERENNRGFTCHQVCFRLWQTLVPHVRQATGHICRILRVNSHASVWTPGSKGRPGVCHVCSVTSLASTAFTHKSRGSEFHCNPNASIR